MPVHQGTLIELLIPLLHPVPGWGERGAVHVQPIVDGDVSEALLRVLRDRVIGTDDPKRQSHTTDGELRRSAL